jgi:hypothetical protein
MLTPCVVVLRVWARLPPGDNWDVVGIRLVFFVAAYCGWSWWFGVCSRNVPPWFRGRLPEEFLNLFSRKKVSDEPTTVKEAAIRNQQFVLVAVVSFLFAAGAINLNGLGLQPIARPGRVRTLVAVMMWCQAHPNTTRSTAMLIGTVASAVFVHRLRLAGQRSDENADL